MKLAKVTSYGIAALTVVVCLAFGSAWAVPPYPSSLGVLIKHVAPTLDLEYEWTIEKSADQTEITLSPGQDADLDYTVIVDTSGSTESGWHVSGSFLIVNKTGLPTTITDISVIISPAIVPTVTPATTFPYSMASPEWLWRYFEADLPDGSTRTITVEVTTSSGAASNSDVGIIDFSTATVGDVTDECIDVADDLEGPLGTVCVADAPEVFEYTMTVGPFNDPDDCGEHRVVNTASFITNDNGYTGESSATVYIDVECCEGTIGDFVWADLNADGIQDVGEPGIVAVALMLFDDQGLIATTVTDGAGMYLFTDLCPGTYTVEVDESTLPPGYVPTIPLAGPADVDSDNSPVEVTLTDDVPVDLTIDFGYILPEECADCAGKITELTLLYLGDVDDANIVVAMKKNGVIFDGIVQPGEMFAFIGTDKNGTMGTEITVSVDGGSETKIHTSCSKPIGIGSIFGDFEVIAGASKDGGPLCPADDPGGCSECKGKVTELTMLYLGDVADANIVVAMKRNGVIFDGIVQPGEMFDFVGTGRNNTMGTEITITVNGGSATAIHTSCSQPIGIGSVFGDFEVVDGASKDGGLFCIVDDIEGEGEPEDCGPCKGKVTELSFLYLGDVVDANIVVAMKKKKNGEVIFDEIVQPGESFDVIGTDKKGTMGTEITITVNGGSGINIHTSCSRPIGIGVVFGDFLVLDGASKDGGPFCP